MRYKKVAENIRYFFRNYITNNNLKSVIIGVSGGIDSTLICALVEPVCKELGIPLIGRSLPIESNKADEIERALMVGKAFCTNFKEIDLTDTYIRLRDDLDAGEGVVDSVSLAAKIKNGNIKARLRMITLYNLAGLHKGIVMSTDNLTEYFLGFWTICGDVGDLGLIQWLWKTEVYGLAGYLADELDILGKENGGDKEFYYQANVLRDGIEAVSTDGLGIANSDLERFGAKSFEEIDRTLKIYLTNNKYEFDTKEYLQYEGRPINYGDFARLRETYVDSLVAEQSWKTNFKRNHPVVLSRERLLG